MKWIAKFATKVKLTDGTYVKIKGGEELPAKADVRESGNLHLWFDLVVEEQGRRLTVEKSTEIPKVLEPVVKSPKVKKEIDLAPLAP